MHRREGFARILVVLIALALTTAATFQPPDDPRKKLEEAVWAKLKKEKLDKDVSEVLVEDSVVTLRGKPRNAYSKMKAIETALAVEGVEAVESDLEVPEPESAFDFTEDLVNRVLNYPPYTVFDDVTFKLEDEGAVILGGYVTMPFKKTDLEERVGKVRGVRELKSEIQVLPASPSDERLRQILFERIYGDQMFLGYAQQKNPPPTSRPRPTAPSRSLSSRGTSPEPRSNSTCQQTPPTGESRGRPR